MRTTPRVILILKQASLATKRCEILVKKVAVTGKNLFLIFNLLLKKAPNSSHAEDQSLIAILSAVLLKVLLHSVTHV